MRRIPENYNWAKPGTYPIRGHSWKVSKSLSDTTIAQTVVNGVKVRFEAAWGDGAGNLTLDRTQVATLLYDADQISGSALRVLVEDAFDAFAAAIAVTVSQEASSSARSAAKEQAAKSKADARAAEVTRKLR
jgi:hypothetical protein